MNDTPPQDTPGYEKLHRTLYGTQRLTTTAWLGLLRPEHPPCARAVVLALADFPSGIGSIAQLAGRAGLTAGAALWVLRALVADGLLRVEHNGLGDYAATPVGEDLGPVPARAPGREAGSVYVLTDGRRVKIGWTSGDVDRRRRAIESASGLSLVLLHAEGAVTREAEASLHERFADMRLRGEWFTLDGPVQEWLAEVRGA